MELDDLAVAPLERRVDVEPGLDEVVSGRDVAEAPHRVAEGRLVDDGLRAGRQVVDVEPEDGRSGRPGIEFLRFRDEEEDAPRSGLVSRRRVDRDLELGVSPLAGRAGRKSARERKAEDQ
jgi:hypothetical protein